MSDLSLGALSAQLKIDMGGLDASVKKAVGGLDKIESAAISTAQKTEDLGKVVKRALAGEVLVNAMNRVSSSLQSLGGEYKGLGEAVQGAGAIIQGLFQGGVIGAGIAAASVGVGALTQMWGEAEKAAKDAEDASMKAFVAHLDRMKALNEQIAEVSTQVRGAILAAKGGTDAASGVRAISAGDAAKREGQLAIERMDVGSQFGAANARLEKLKAAPTYAPGFQAQQIAEQQAVVDGLLTRMRDLDQQLDEAAGASNLIAAQEVLAKATKDATKPLSEFAKAMKEARDWTLGKAGLAQSPGEAARAAVAKTARMNLGAMSDPDGSIASEARKRAERNEGYKSGELLVLDKPLSRLAHVFDNSADMISDGAKEFAQEIADVAGQAAQSLWKSLAPKTFSVAENLAGGNIGEAIAAALSQSVEFQAVGKALDSGLVEIINAITEVLRPAVPVITMAIRAVVEAAKVVMGIVDIVASALQLDTVFAIVFEAVKFLAAILSVGAFAVQYALDGLQNAFKNAAIGFLSLGIFAGAFQTQVDDLKKSLVVQGDFVAGASKAFDDIMKIGFNAEIAAVGMADAAAAADKVAASFLNLPAGFKTAAAIYGATSASSAPFGGYAPPAAPGLPPLAAAAGGGSSGGGGSGDTFNFYAPIYVSGDEGFTNVVTVSAHQSSMATSGTTGGRQSNRQSPTPHAPNATQPYTPASP